MIAIDVLHRPHDPLKDPVEFRPILLHGQRQMKIAVRLFLQNLYLVAGAIRQPAFDVMIDLHEILDKDTVLFTRPFTLSQRLVQSCQQPGGFHAGAVTFHQKPHNPPGVHRQNLLTQDTVQKSLVFHARVIRRRKNQVQILRNPDTRVHLRDVNFFFPQHRIQLNPQAPRRRVNVVHHQINRPSLLRFPDKPRQNAGDKRTAAVARNAHPDQLLPSRIIRHRETVHRSAGFPGQLRQGLVKGAVILRRQREQRRPGRLHTAPQGVVRTLIRPDPG